MSEKVNEKELTLNELIEYGLRYIDFLKEDEKLGEISILMLFDIRKYLVDRIDDLKWYNEKFEVAYEHDLKIKKGVIKPTYKDDGLKYYFDNNRVTSYVLYTGNENLRERIFIEKTIENPSKNYIRSKTGDYYKYYYINEIDHFFTYCINNYLLGKGFAPQEEGIKSIGNRIDEYAESPQTK